MTGPLPDWLTMPRPERVEMLRTLVGRGFSMGQIACKFQNASRNAIIGLVHRVEKAEGKPMKRCNLTGTRPRKNSAPTIHIPKKKPPVSRRPTPAEVQVSTPVEVEIRQLAELHAPVDIDRIAKADAFVPIPGITPIPITELPNRMRCRWPVETPGERHFACGADTASETHVYCAPHRRLSLRGAQSQGASQ